MVNKLVIVAAVAVVVIAIGLGVGLGVDWGGSDSDQETSNITPAIIGDSVFIRITNNDMTDEDGGNVRSKFSYTISEPGASFIAIHFASFDFNRECTMELTDENDYLVASYTDQGRLNRGNFWAHHVEGDTLNMLVYCVRAAGDNKRNFVIDEMVKGFSDNENLETLTEPDQRTDPQRRLRAEELFPFDLDRHRGLALCGGDDSNNAVCFKDSHPDEYNKAKAICRLKIAGKGTCTGWLVGPNNLVLTNRHCIESQADVDNTDFQFMAEGANCGDSKTKTAGYDVYEGAELVAESFQKDYALIRLVGDPAAKYGFMEIDDRVATVGETIFIPGHPVGRAKQFALEDTWPTSGASNGRCAVLDVGSDNCGYSFAYQSIQYTCDTLGGSSGSPVIAVDTMKVIGLHHCGHLNCDLGNLAVPFEGPGIYNDIKEFIDAPAPQTSSPTTSPPTAAPKTPAPTTPRPTEGPPSTNPPTQNPTVEGTLRCFAPKIQIQIQLDDFAAETRWELWQTDPPRIISQGGNYENNALIEEEHCLADDGVHYLKFFDEFGDGFCCGKGFGYYKVWYNNQLLYHNNGETGTETEVEISPQMVCLEVFFHLTLETDRFGVETTWELRDDSDSIVGSGGPYPGAFRLVEESVCATSFGTYTFTMFDSFGDGMCCDAGQAGGFKLYRDNEIKIESTGEFNYFVRYDVPSIGNAEIIAGS
ncbi:unnamed protein product [Cylindrotheca closterium]|uniref:Serine protease n=1 Tax=Cylindrotheca closterium TaxID=2856 RepID=A0AAD2FEY9_9STRA|nr:unnamed protein product [Cylindrotheca closterium]